MSRKRSLALLLVSTVLTIPAFTATAATAGQGATASQPILGEVLVTATRRQAESINKVAMSISALPQNQLDDLDIKTGQDLSRLVPALRITANGPTGRNISIRGVTSTIGAATTGVYLDDTAMQTRNLVGISTGGGVYLPQSFDLQRIEVLKGPQGTLYGGSSEGGTIRYITTQPSLDHFSGYAKGEINSTYKGGTGYEAGAAIGGPIVQDKLGFRISAWGRYQAGWINHVNWRDPSDIIARDTNSMASQAYRAALRFEPSPSVKITPSIYFSRENQHDQNLIYKDIPQYTTAPVATLQSTNKPLDGTGLLPTGYTAPTTAGVYTNVPGHVGENVYIYPAQTYGPVNLGKYDTIVNTLVGDSYVGPLSPEKAPRVSSLLLPSLTIDVDAGPVEIKSITSYVHDKSRGNLQLTYTETLNTFATNGYSPLTDTSILHDVGQNGVFFGYYFYQAHRQAYSEELRFSSNYNDSPLSWVAGLYYNNATTDSQNSAPENRTALQEVLLGHPQFFSPAHTAAEIAGLVQIGTAQTLKEEELAGYGELNYNITRKLKATAGVRVTRSKIDYTSASDGLLLPWPAGQGPKVAGTIKETPVTPKFGLSYQANDDDLFYVTAAKGYRAGGVQQQANPTQCKADLDALGIKDTPVTYGSDSVWSYEGGAKVGIAGRARLSASAFYINWNKPQTPYILPSCVFRYTENVGKAVSQGFDLQGNIAITDGLTFSFAGSYTDAHYTQTVTSVTGGTLVGAGDKLTGIPAWQGNANLRYDFAVTSNNMAYIMGSYQYVGKFYNSGGPGTPSYSPDYFTTPAMSYVTVRAGVDFNDLEVSVFADNLFNEDKLQPNSLSGRYNCRNAACTVYGSYYHDVKGSTYRPRTIGLTVTYRY